MSACDEFCEPWAESPKQKKGSMGAACASRGVSAEESPRGVVTVSEGVISADAARQLRGEAESRLDSRLQANRINMSRFVNAEPPPASDPDSRMLRAVAAASVYSATEEHFQYLTTAPDASVRLNELGFELSPASMNFGCTGLSIIIELSREIRDAGEGVHNEPITIAQLGRVYELRAMWVKMLDAHSIRSIQHPRLGVVPIVQPLLHTLIQARGHSQGNGIHGSPDPIFAEVIAAGARTDIPSSLGFTPMHAVIDVHARSAEYTDEDDEYGAEGVRRNLALARMLLKHGASVLEPTVPHGARGVEGLRRESGLKPILAEPRGYSALEACRWQLARHHSKGLEQLAGVLEEAAAAEQRSRARDDAAELIKGPGSDGWRDRANHPLARADLPTPSWVQAIFNIAWLTSQLTVLETAAERRRLLTEISPRAPFQVPLMTVVPWSTLKRLGRLPKRDTSRAHVEDGWDGPVPVALLPANATVVFLSHRWLRPGHPDDADTGGTKFSQITSVMELLAAELGGRAEELYLWADYSCIDQSNPFPGVQMLPAIMACCEEFVYVSHEQYPSRAWCRTEQFFNWRLKCHDRKWRLDGTSITQERPEGSAEPATGQLYSEADRVALVNMTALFSSPQ